MDCTRGYSLLALVPFFLCIIPPIASRAPLITSLKTDGSSGTVRITCAALGNPKPIVTWKFNNKELVESSRIEFKHDNKSMLILKDTSQADTGKYRCVATNYFGSIYADLDLKIKGIGEFQVGFQQDDECQSRNVTIGRPYVLNCPPHTKPYGQEYKWVVEPLEIWKAGYPLDRIFTSPNGSLMFSYVKKSDISFINAKGGLSCGLVVDLKIVPSVSVKLVSNGKEFTGTAKPKIVTFMKPLTTVVKGSNVKLQCGAIGKPHPEFTWFKNGKFFYSSLKKPIVKGLTVEGKGLLLSFRSIQLTDAGRYKCIAKNSAGTDSREATLIVNAPVHWLKPLPIHNARPVRQPIRLECNGTGKPLPTYKWMHNSTQIQSTADRKINGGVLEISSLKFSDTGFYLCIAENYINSKVTAAFIDVRAFAPTINTPLPHLQYFITGKKYTLFCDVEGGPLPAITWYHNNKPLGTNQAKIEFSAASKDHAGVYKCKASNVKGVVEQSTTVEVYDPTVITIGPDKFSFHEGTTANLFCDATYDTTLDVTFQWLKDGKLVKYDDRVKLKHGFNWKTTGLQINNLLVGNVGSYTCRVFTKDDKTFKSMAEKTGSITMLTAPTRPENVKLEGDCTSKTVKLSWSASSIYVGPPAYYMVEYSHVDEETKWFTYNEKVTETSLEIKTDDLPPSANLVFRVKAVAIIDGEQNIGKACDRTAVGACVVAAGNPVSPLIGLEAAVDDNGNVVVSWEKMDKIMQTEPGFKIVAEIKKKVNGTLGDTKQVKVNGDQTSVKISVSDDDKKNKNDDVEYEVMVYGENAKGAGPAETVYVKNPSNIVLPNEMSDIKAVSVTSDSVSLEWKEVSSATGYMIYYTTVISNRRRRSLSKETKSKKVPAGTKGKIDGLQSNQKYEISVSALNLKGEGPKSTPIEVQTKKGAPGKPKDVDLKTFGQAIVLEWTPPKDAKDHEVTWYPSADPSKKKTKPVPANKTQAIIDSDLEPLKYYTVELSARNDEGKGKPWKMVGVVVGQKDRPGKPGDPLIEPLNGTAIKVTFKLPDESHGGLPNKYHVYHVKQDTSDDAKKTSADYPETPSVILTDLDLAIYKIWTVPENSEGVGSKSAVKSAMPKAPTTQPPTLRVITTPKTRNITDNGTFILPSTQDNAKEFYNELWFIILLAIILLIIIILLLICAILNKSGGKYPVGDKEKKFGGWDNQQLQDYSDNPMEKPNGLPFKDTPKRHASDSSISKPIIDDNDDPDNDSLDFYGEDNKFEEDGSFIGEYGDDKKSITNDIYYS